MSVTVLYTLAAAVVWVLIIGEISVRQIVVGLIAGAGLALITRRGPRRAIPIRELPVRLLYLLVYVLVLIPYDILQSNLDMARRLLRSKPDIRPGIIRIDLGDVSDATSALVAHALTMTPGELVIDYSDDGKAIYVHLIDASDVERRRAAFWRLYHRVLERVFS